MANTVVVRKQTLVVYIGGSIIGHVRGASWSGSFGQPYNEGKVIVTQLPMGWDNNQTMSIVAGNGTNHAVRFNGFCRSPIYNLDGSITIQGVSRLAAAYEYQNSEDPESIGGLNLYDLLGGTATGTDEQIVKAVLDKVGIFYTAANIGGTGIVWGSQQVPQQTDGFIWAAADSPTGVGLIPGVGERAIDYIARYDKVSAVHPGPWAPAGSESDNSTGAVTSAVGFYRTYETLNGTIRRTLMGGRPRGTPTIATPFTEGVDIRTGTITRGYPVGNRFACVGYDDGTGAGPEYFSVQSSNPYMPATRAITCPPISSSFVEKSAELDYGGSGMNGMSCERVARALEPDWNRVIVSGTIATGRDDYISHGATILVQAPGGLPGRLGTGENVWVQTVRGSVSLAGFMQEFEILGGGVPDNYLPAVPQS